MDYKSKLDIDGICGYLLLFARDKQLLKKPLRKLAKRPVSHDFGEKRPKMNKDIIELEGKVVEALPSAVFRVLIDSGQEILAHISGRLRVNHIRILPGDRVRVELTPYDLTRGRITRRL